MSNLRISGAASDPRSESDIRLNYGDQSKIIAASNDISSASAQALFYSSDGGSSWGQTNLPFTSSDSRHADPAVDWTSDGTAWTITIGITGGVTNQLRCYKSIDGGQTWSFDSTPSGTQTAVDREIMWVDHSPTSSYKDQIYVTWHNGSPAFVARRTAGSGGTWQTPVQVSGTETTGTAIGGDIKTNSFGDVFAFWPDNGGSRTIYVAKSTNGGSSFATPVSIVNPSIGSIFASTRIIDVPADAGRGARVYVSGGAYRTATKNLVYAVWTDLNGATVGATVCTSGSGPGTSVSSTCTSRIWFSRSTNGGANWSTPVMLNNQSSLNDQFHARLCVDESNGNLMVVYYDTVADPGRIQTDVWMKTSKDDGQTWSTAVKVTTAQTNETAVSADSGNQYGDYIGLSGYAGKFFPSWTDRRSGASEEIWTALITIAVGNLHVVGLTGDGKLWHTIRLANGSWQSFFGDVKAQESNDPGPFTTVSCAGAGGDLHVVGLTGDGKLWHTIRFANGSWQSFFGDVKAQESNDPGPFIPVGIGGV